MSNEDKDFTEFNGHGRVNVNGCGLLPETARGISLDVGVGFRDDEGDAMVVLDAHGGPRGLSYRLSAHKARALAALLLDAVEDMERNS